MQFFLEDRYRIFFTRRRMPDGCDYLIPNHARHRPACALLLKGKFHEPRTLKLVETALRARPGNIVHAGTFYGDMLPSFARSAGAEGRVYAFEPLLENYVLARGGVDANGLDNVVLFSAALGDEVGPCRMTNTLARDPARHAGGASHLAEDGTLSATMLRLDGLGLERVSVLHLDTEGTELAALRGGEKTIGASRPAIFVEDNRKNCAGFLESLGYRHLGDTPALHVWCPGETTALAEAILGADLLKPAG